jgi:soluble lytic murein transglycosylase
MDARRPVIDPALLKLEYLIPFNISKHIETIMKALKLFASLLIVLSSQTSAANDGSPDRVKPDDAVNRTQFVELEKQLKTAPYAEVAGLIAPLKDYPLYPYLQYQVYERFPERLTQAEVSRFLDAYPLFPRRTRLQQAWLKQLAKENHWSQWLTAYQKLPVKSEIYQCDLARAYLETGQQKQGMALAAELWTVGKSLPAQCDPLFEQWMKHGNPTAAVANSRYWLAIQADETRLGNYLHRFLKGDANKLASAYEALLKQPEQMLAADLSVFPESARQFLIKKTFQGLARQNPEATAERWITYRQTLPAKSSLTTGLDLYIGRRLINSQSSGTAALLNRLDPEFQNAGLTEARLLQALGAAKDIEWLTIQTLIERLPETLKASDRWRYWYARAVQNIAPDTPALEGIWNQLAQSRSFYGFLAAARQNLPFNLNNEPLTEDAAVLAALQKNPAVRRAKEWLALNRRDEATREWYSARASVNQSEREHMAALAFDWGWYHQAIMDAVQQQQWNYLEVRFPVLFADVFDSAAGKNKIDPTWATAIARQESAFKSEVVSRAGARGLMQLMPATARATSRKHGVPLAGVDQLFEPETNIALGTAYLADMYERFDRNRAYASAAYNAGPNRVDRWLKERGHLPLDAWIETIPYDETRNYVQNVLAFRVIYGQRSGQAVTMLSPDERLLLASRDKAEAGTAEKAH